MPFRSWHALYQAHPTDIAFATCSAAAIAVELPRFANARRPHLGGGSQALQTYVDDIALVGEVWLRVFY